MQSKKEIAYRKLLSFYISLVALTGLASAIMVFSPHTAPCGQFSSARKRAAGLSVFTGWRYLHFTNDGLCDGPFTGLFAAGDFDAKSLPPGFGLGITPKALGSSREGEGRILAKIRNFP